jgi:uncharacterized protein YodC (DUF2158 family)
MADEIKAGDVVRLKSGGPKMTVQKVEPWDGATRAWCEWFINDRNQSGGFPLSSLKRVDSTVPL